MRPAATSVAGLAFTLAPRVFETAPLTGTIYRPRVRTPDRSVHAGGSVFGVGWGLSGMIPGATFASLGIGNYPMVVGIAGMFAGASLPGWWRSRPAELDHTTAAAD